MKKLEWSPKEDALIVGLVMGNVLAGKSVESALDEAKKYLGKLCYQRWYNHLKKDYEDYFKKGFNDYDVRGNETVIFINREKEGILECLIDTDDLPIVQKLKRKWQAIKGANTFYAICTTGEKKEPIHNLLHRHLFGSIHWGNLVEVDHINGNGLDNRRNNLRITSKSGNQQNRNGLTSTNKSGYRNVSWNKSEKCWVADFVVDGKKYFIGRFNDVHEAGRAVSEAREKYMPHSKEAWRGGNDA